MRFPLDTPSFRLAERTKRTDQYIGRTNKASYGRSQFIYCSRLLLRSTMLVRYSGTGLNVNLTQVNFFSNWKAIMYSWLYIYIFCPDTNNLKESPTPHGRIMISLVLKQLSG